jgi:hypothetical protein
MKVNSFAHNRASDYAQLLLNSWTQGNSGEIESAIMRIVNVQNPSRAQESERLEIVQAVAHLFQRSLKDGIREPDLRVGLDMLRHVIFGPHVPEPATTDVPIENPASCPQ